MTTRIFAAFALFVATSACSDGRHALGPTAPTSVTAVTGLSISPATDLIKLQTREQFTATATLADGGLQPVAAFWGSENPEVVTVTHDGQATATGSGRSTIFAVHGGHRATRSLRVVPAYQGRWEGSWRVTGCRDEGDWSGLCTEFRPGLLWGLAASLTQDRDAVTGTVDFGRLPGPMGGSILANGHLALSGAYTIALENEIAIDIAVADWETYTLDNERMTGGFRATMQAPWCRGSLSVAGELVAVVKISGPAGPVTARGVVDLNDAIARMMVRRE